MSNLKQCDLIMKGGVTSGVVYPQAIMEISKEYRLRSIGGTSAGSMAAALAAAAEYYRQKNGGDDAGFQKFASVDRELATGMGDMLQPSPALAPLFEIGLDILKHQGLPKGAVAQLAALRRY
ncbi:MAG: patatin, partial [Pseudomonadota bacterium]